MDMRVKGLHSGKGFLVAGTFLFLVNSPIFAADGSCKGLSASACGQDPGCTWVAGYTTKKGVQVEAYCRLRSGKSGGVSGSSRSSMGKDKPKT